MTFCSAVYWGNRLKLWNTRPKCSRFLRMASSLCVLVSAALHSVSPATVMLPVSAVSRKFRQRSSVVLPEPDEPMMARASPSARSNEMSRSTFVAPKLLPMPFTSNNAIAAPPYLK